MARAAKGFARLDPWYVTGFCDGEGTFTFSRRTRGLALYFGIKLTEKDRPVLEAIQAFFGGIGKIYYHRRPPIPPPNAGFSKPAAYFRVTRIAELQRVVEHFDEYPPQGCKRESYRIWREMVVLKTGGFGAPPWEELDRLAVKLSAASPRNQPMPSTS